MTKVDMNQFDAISSILNDDERIKSIETKYDANKLNADHADYDENVESDYYQERADMMRTILRELFW